VAPGSERRLEAPPLMAKTVEQHARSRRLFHAGCLASRCSRQARNL